MSTTKLTDTQLVILSAASRREDRGVVLPTNLKGGAAHKLVAKLVDHGFIEEVRARGDLPVWRRDDDNRAMALRISRRGLKAIAVEDGPDDQQGSEDEPGAGGAVADGCTDPYVLCDGGGDARRTARGRQRRRGTAQPRVFDQSGARHAADASILRATARLLRQREDHLRPGAAVHLPARQAAPGKIKMPAGPIAVQLMRFLKAPASSSTRLFCRHKNSPFGLLALIRFNAREV
jgi:hypothetical protein